MSPQAPPRSVEQRRAALRRANELRCGKARIKRELKALGSQGGLAMAAGMLRCMGPWDGTAYGPEGCFSVLELLMAIPGVGRVKARRVLVDCGRFGPSPTKRLRALSGSQRRALALAIERQAGRMRRAGVEDREAA